jgi:hypothetical protein
MKVYPASSSFRHVKRDKPAKDAANLGALSDPLRSSCLGLAMLSVTINYLIILQVLPLHNIDFSFPISSQQRRLFSIRTEVSRPPDQGFRFAHPALAWLGLAWPPSKKELNPSIQFRAVRRQPSSSSCRNFSCAKTRSDAPILCII